jgi:DNA polymerase-1
MARPTELPPPASDDTLYLVDLAGYVFRAYHAIEALTNASGEPTNATYGTLTMLTKLMGERRPVHLAVALEGESNFRDTLDPRYKATRPPPPPDLTLQMRRCIEIVQAYRIPALVADGYEADDVIATIATQALAAGMRVVIASADKDLMQLCSERCMLWDAMRDRVYGPPEVLHKFGVGPDKLRDLLALVGDTSDNVPGVPGVGLKTAADLLTQFESIDDLYARIEEVKKPRIKQSLLDHKDDALISRSLVTLQRDAPVAFDREALSYKGGDVERLRVLFTELGFTRQLSNLPRAAKAKPVLVSARFREVVSLDELRAFAEAARAKGSFAVHFHTSEEDAMRCHVVGIALAHTLEQALYVPLSHRSLLGPKQLSESDVFDLLGPLLTDETIRKVGHDLKRADVVLGRRGLRLRGVELDLMLASYLLDPEVSHELLEVCEREGGVRLTSSETLLPKDRSRKRGTLDEASIEESAHVLAAYADGILRAADRLRTRLAEADLASLLADLEQPLAAVLGDLELRGVMIDPSVLREIGEAMSSELAKLEVRAREVSGHPDLNVSSPKQLETILFDELGLKAVKRTKTGRSTDAEALEAIADEHPLPEVVLEHRVIAKLKGTYVDALPRLVHLVTGRIHGHWRQAVAATGRISSEEPNLQNIPIRTELGRQIRKAFVAPPGQVFLSADYSQIELRVLAHLSQDPLMVDAFRKGEDIHARTAMEVFGVAEDAVTDDMRRKSKTVNFGVIYGMGETALSKRLGIPRKEAASFIEAYFQKYAGVAEFMRRTMAEAKRTEKVKTLLGRVRILPDLHNSDRMKRAYAERIAQNTPIQGTAADILKLAMVKLRAPVVPGAHMVLTVHDELDFEVPEPLAEEAAAKIRTAMEGVVELSVPLVVDVGWGKTWAEAHG